MDSNDDLEIEFVDLPDDIWDSLLEKALAGETLVDDDGIVVDQSVEEDEDLAFGDDGFAYLTTDDGYFDFDDPALDLPDSDDIPDIGWGEEDSFDF